MNHFDPLIFIFVIFISILELLISFTKFIEI